MANESSGKGKKPANAAPAPEVEFSDAPKKKRVSPNTNRRMDPAIYDRDDEIAEKLQQAKAIAEQRAASEPTEEPKWVPVNEATKDIDTSTAAKNQVSPSDLARKYAAKNDALLTNDRATVNPQRAARNSVVIPATGRTVTRVPSGQVIRRVQTPLEAKGEVYRGDIEGLKTKYKEYFPDRAPGRGGALYPGHDEEGLPVDRYGGFNAVNADNAVREQDEFKAREEESRKAAERARLASTPASSDSSESGFGPVRPAPSSLTILTAEDRQARRAAEAAKVRQTNLNNSPAISHVPEIDRQSGAVRLIPIKQLGGEHVRDEANARVFSPNENGISTDSFEPSMDANSAAVGSGIGWPGAHQHAIVHGTEKDFYGNTVPALRPAFIKRTTTYRRVNAGAGFDLIPEVKQHEGLFYKHPTTGAWTQSFDTPTTSHNEWAKEQEKNRLNTQVANESEDQSSAKELASHPMYSLLHAAIDKHHQTLFAKYNGVGRTYYGDDGKEKVAAKVDADDQERNAKHAANYENTSKLWVANHLQHFFSVLGDQEGKSSSIVARQIKDAIIKNPDHILKFFSVNKDVIGDLYDKTKAKAYKEGVKTGVVPKRIVPEKYNPDAPMKNAVAAVDRAPSRYDAQAARRAAGMPPVAESRLNALNLGASEGK